MDSSPAQSPSEVARQQVEDALDTLGLSPDEVPAPIVDRMRDRARQPGSRLAVGRYLIVGELGRGGMGVVYEGWDPGIERRVAIKTIEPDLVPEEDREEVVERFRRETKVVGRLKHRTIVTVFDSGRERAKDPITGQRYTALYYYVMEYIDGHSLARALRERERLPEVEALKIVCDIAEALQLSHDAGIIHRDIKPSNIFLRGGTEAVLLDFGIAKSGSVALTRQGQILGTPSYLAPERLREKEVAIDGRADIFSLGVLLFTMVTGDAPFVGDDVYDIIDKITRAPPPELDRRTPTGAALADVINRMLAKRREDRFQSATEVSNALRSVLRQIETAEAADPHPGFEEVVDFEEIEEDLEKTSPSSPTPLADTGPIRAEIETLDHTPDAELDAPETEVFDSDPELGTTPSLHDIAEGLDTASVSADVVTPEEPVRVADVLGTRPDLALLRETRELRGTRPVIEEFDDFAAPSLEDTSPSVPPGVLQAVTAGAVDEAHVYTDHSPENDESTDDETIADPSARVPSSIRNQLILPASQRHIVTEHVVRAGHPEHSELATEAEAPLATPSVRGVPPRHRRSRIEASLVDEDDVVVQPAPLDALNPDELPTQTQFELPPAGAQPRVLDAEDLVRTRADSGIADPAESQPDRPLPQGAAKLRDREFELSEPHGQIPELDMPKSAAVARRTIGPVPDRARQSPAQVRVKGDPVLEGFERSRLIRRRIFLLIVATLASVAIGLLLGRMKRSNPPPKAPAAGLVPVDPAEPVAEPREGKVRRVPGTDEPALVRPRPASEIIKDAEAARLSGHLDEAARMFESAIRASADGSALRAKAVLGRADVLRQLGQPDDAVRLYRMVAKGHPNSPEAEQARAALEELGRPLKARRRAADRPEPEAAPPPAAPAPTPAPKTPQQRCRTAVRDNLSNPRGAVRALQELQREIPQASCVFWYLGNKHEQLSEYPAAIEAYRRYLSLEPDTPRRAAVNRKIRDLEARVRQR